MTRRRRPFPDPECCWRSNRCSRNATLKRMLPQAARICSQQSGKKLKCSSFFSISIKIGRLILSDCIIDFSRKRPRIVDRCLDFHLWPLEMSGYGGHIFLIAVDEQHDFPDGECAPLNVGLPPRGRISKVDESKFRLAQAFLHQARTGVAGGSSMPIRHAFETLSALRWQAHADDHRTG